MEAPVIKEFESELKIKTQNIIKNIKRKITIKIIRKQRQKKMQK